MKSRCEDFCPDAIAELVCEGIIAIGQEWDILFLNQEAARFLEHFSPEGSERAGDKSAFLGKKLLELKVFDPDSEPMLSIRETMSHSGIKRFTAQVHGASFEFSLRKQASAVLIAFRDVTRKLEIKQREERLTRELHAISSCIQAIIGAENEKTLLTEICRIICEQAGYRMAWVGYANQDEKKSVTPAAWAGHEDGYLQELHLSWGDNERGRGPTGSALRTNAKSYCSDFSTDPSVALWREAALRRGYLSSIVLPLRDRRGEAFGSLSIYSSELAAFDSEDARILELFASDLAFGINALRERKELQKVREEAHQAAISASQSKSAFLANMSHEIRTPLAAILGFSEMITRFDLNVAKRAEVLQAIQRNGRVLSNIIDDILDLSKVEAGKLAVCKSEFLLEDLLRDLANAMEPKAKEKGLSFEIERGPGLPAHLYTDPCRFAQVLFNLMGNAIKFTDSGSVSLTVLSLEKNGIEVRVRDTGVGIAPSERPKLFTPFSQADPSNRRRFGGTGLGLALSRKLAELLNGEIELAESEPGRGSVFVFKLFDCRHELPAETVSLEGEKSADAFLDPQPLRGVRVLLAEDSPDMQDLNATVLKLWGAEAVEIAPNGRAALEKVAADAPYDIILMDIQMPGMDGLEAARRLREAGLRTPIIAMTAHAMKEERDSCLRLGFDEHISKPIDFDLLRDRIVQLVGRKGTASRNALSLLPAGPQLN
jgi:signal transduction histidine kinase/ActR/RegA family two-component response regulator